MSNFGLAIAAMFAALAVGVGCGSDSTQPVPENNNENNSTTLNNAATSTNAMTGGNAQVQDWCRESVDQAPGRLPLSTRPVWIAQQSETLWAVVDVDRFDRQVVRSENAGAEWTPVPLPEGQPIVKVLGNDDYLIAPRTRDAFERSTDGGLNWHTVAVQGPMATAQYLGMPDGSFLRWSLVNGTIEHSNDGLDWTPVPVPGDAEPLAVSVGSEGTISVTRDRGVDLSQDLGQSWTTVTPPGPFESFTVFTDEGETRMIARSTVNRGIVWESDDGTEWGESTLFGRDPIPVVFTQVGPDLFADGGWSGRPVKKRNSSGDWVDMPDFFEHLRGYYEVDGEFRLVTGEVEIISTDVFGTVVSRAQLSDPIEPELLDATFAFGQTLVSWWWHGGEDATRGVLGVIEPDCSTRVLAEPDRARFSDVWAVPGLVLVARENWPDFEPTYLVATDESLNFVETTLPIGFVTHLVLDDEVFVAIGYLNDGMALTRSVDGLTWTDPEPVLKTIETVELEGAESALISIAKLEQFQGDWIANSVETGSLYVSENLTEWSVLETELPVGGGLDPFVVSVAASPTQLFIFVFAGPEGERERALLTTSDLVSWDRSAPPETGSTARLSRANDTAVFETAYSAAFGDERDEAFVYLFHDGDWVDLISHDGDLRYLGAAPGRYFIARDDVFVPLE